MMLFASNSIRSLGELRDRASAQFKVPTTTKSWFRSGEKCPTAPTADSDRPAKFGNEKVPIEIPPTSSSPVPAAQSLFEILHLELVAHFSPRTLEALGAQAGVRLARRNHDWTMCESNETLAVFIQSTFWVSLFGQKAETLKGAAMERDLNRFLINSRIFPWSRGACFEHESAFMKGLLTGVIGELSAAPMDAVKVHVERHQPGVFGFFFGVPQCPTAVRCAVLEEHLRLQRLEANEARESEALTSFAHPQDVQDSSNVLETSSDEGSDEHNDLHGDLHSDSLIHSVACFEAPSHSAARSWANVGFIRIETPI